MLCIFKEIVSGKFSANTQLTPHHARTLVVSLIVVHHSLLKGIRTSLLRSLYTLIGFIYMINKFLTLTVTLTVPLSIPPFVGYTIFYLVKTLLYFLIDCLTTSRL